MDPSLSKIPLVVHEFVLVTRRGQTTTAYPFPLLNLFLVVPQGQEDPLEEVRLTSSFPSPDQIDICRHQIDLHTEA